MHIGFFCLGIKTGAGKSEFKTVKLNSKAYWVIQPWYDNHSGKRKTLYSNFLN